MLFSLHYQSKPLTKFLKIIYLINLRIRICKQVFLIINIEEISQFTNNFRRLVTKIRNFFVNPASVVQQSLLTLLVHKDTKAVLANIFLCLYIIIGSHDEIKYLKQYC